MKPDLKPYEGKMQKSLDVLAENLAGIRAGRANASVLNKITVDYYGTASPIQQVAAVASPDPRTLTIQPWDASLLKEIVKAIQTSELGINPQNDGKLIRLSFPPLTEERRKELIKQVSKEGEESKVAIRNIRRDAIDKWKAAKKKSEITEDELADAEKDMQKLTDKFVADADKRSQAKEKEIMDLQGRIQEFQANAEGELAAKQEELTKPMLDKIKTAIDAVVKAKGLAYVFEKTMVLSIGESAIDITADVKAKLGL